MVVGKPFPKGTSGNLSGRPKTDPAVRKFQELTYKEFIDRLQHYSSYTRSEIQEVISDKETRIMDLIYCKHLNDAYKGKDLARESLYNRMWGKVKESDFTPQFSAEHELMKRIPLTELIELARKYAKEETK